MSQNYNTFTFSNGLLLDKSQDQIQTNTLKINQSFNPPLVGMEEDSSGLNPVYGTTVLSEMFNYQSGTAGPTAAQFLENQTYRNLRTAPSQGEDWFLHRQGVDNITDSSTAMQLFGMNNSEKTNSTSSSTLHMLLPHHPTSSSSSNLRDVTGEGFSQFSWAVPNNTGNIENTPSEIPAGIVGLQGLSLSLSSSQRIEDGEMNMFFRHGGVGQSHQFHGGVGSSVNVLRNSRYIKPAQELLGEFCSVGYNKGQTMKKNKLGGQKSNSSSNPSGGAGAGGGNSAASSTAAPTHLSAADRIEHHRRKVKLISMLDEVDRRYNNYCEQIQMVVNSFDMVIGFGAALPYTCLAQKAMSRHFKCLKEAIAAQLKRCCEMLGEKDTSSTGGTKGETPRLKILELSLRQQRAFSQMGMMEQEAWRPQRGLPERSVNILRAWLFEHFLHPYPSDADKHILARQTGLSRNQVSNWFINARVRLWKPMIEEMYLKEANDDSLDEEDQNHHRDHSTTSTQSPTPPPPATATTTASTSTAINTTPENDHSSVLVPINRQQQLFSHNQPNFPPQPMSPAASSSAAQSFPVDTWTNHPANDDVESTLIRFGGDVSLTLGLRHAGNLSQESRFFSRNFEGC